MNYADEFDRIDAPWQPAGLRPELRVVGDEPRSAPREPRAVGSPLPAGSGGQNYRTAPPPGRSLPASADSENAQRAMGVLSAAMPFVQKLLPLLDTHFVGAIANLFNPRPQQAPPIQVDLAPVQNQVSELQLQQIDLRSQVLEQNATLKRFEDQLELVREATDRNTLEQQELIEDLKAVGNKVNLFAIALCLLLVISVLLNLVLFLHINRVLP